MNRRDRQIFLVMIMLFTLVFGPILLFSWKDWHEMLLMGVRHAAGVDDYAWSAVGFSSTATPIAIETSRSNRPTTAAYIPISGQASISTASLTPASTRTPFLSRTPKDRPQSFQNPALAPSRTPTTRPAATATLVHPTNTPQPAPTDTLVPTSTRIPSRTPRPPATRTSIPQASNTAVPPATEPPPTQPEATEPPATEPPPTQPPATDPPETEPPATEPPATEPATTEPATT
ncbi:MAG TPA: hypothetical protein VK249_23800 [Anaerolineales bacterium]|nr:hypothetical protein [Anaerolineales bacterium]